MGIENINRDNLRANRPCKGAIGRYCMGEDAAVGGLVAPEPPLPA